MLMSIMTWRCSGSAAVLACVLSLVACAPADEQSAVNPSSTPSASTTASNPSGSVPQRVPGQSSSPIYGDGEEEATPDPVRATPIPAPSAGTIDDVIPVPSPVPTEEVPLDETAELEGTTELRVVDVTAVSVEAQTPGEVAGPALAVEVEIKNGSDADLDLSSTMVTLVGAGDVLGQPTTSEPYSPFMGAVLPGDSATATYVFLIPEDSRSRLSITVQYLAEAPVALFIGSF